MQAMGGWSGASVYKYGLTENGGPENAGPTQHYTHKTVTVKNS